jgi:acyl-homoserine-lactone acylase
MLGGGTAYNPPMNWLPVLLLALVSGLPSFGKDQLASQVTIYRDEYGVPHIVGETEPATFFGYGYAQAEDHLERMMLQYRDAQGRRAEVVGFQALGDGYLHFIPYEYRWDGDYLQRLLRTKQAVVDNRAKIDPQVYPILDAFARGVNEYINEHRATVPAWIDSIKAEDVEALERSNYMRFYSIQDALAKVEGGTYEFPNFGSNQWAISKRKSANGHIMHIEHTHMPWANRFQNFEAHLITPGKLNAGGISWFGSPFFLDGFNDRITWSATWNEPNIADVYEEKINPENHFQYLYDGKWRDIQVDKAVFRVKGPNGMETITLPLYYTHHGPVVRYDEEKHRAWSVKLPNYDGVNYSLGLYGLMKSHNLPEFKAAVSKQLMPRWNLLYSDTNNIYWVHNGNVAERADGFDWRKPIPGWTSATEWGPYLPFKAYPQLENPPSGFLQNCNNPPWVATKNSGLKPLEPAPYYMRPVTKADAGEESLNTRGERVFQVLGEEKKFTLQDMVDLGFDTYNLAADVVVPLLTRAYDANPSTDPRVTRAMKQIRDWDRRSSKESVAFTYVYYWGKAYGDLFSKPKFARFNSYSRKNIDLNSAEEQRMARTALEEGVKRIEKQFGNAEVPWGKINVVVRGGSFPLGGNAMFGVLHPDEGTTQDNGEIHCNDGWGHLLVVIESDPKQIWTLLPYGQSEDKSSPHYNDQAKLHSERKVKRFWFTPEDIFKHSESVWGDRNRIKVLIH